MGLALLAGLTSDYEECFCFLLSNFNMRISCLCVLQNGNGYSQFSQVRPRISIRRSAAQPPSLV